VKIINNKDLPLTIDIELAGKPADRRTAADCRALWARLSKDKADKFINQ